MTSVTPGGSWPLVTTHDSAPDAPKLPSGTLIGAPGTTGGTTAVVTVIGIAIGGAACGSPGGRMSSVLTECATAAGTTAAPASNITPSNRLGSNTRTVIVAVSPGASASVGSRADSPRGLA